MRVLTSCLIACLTLSCATESPTQGRHYVQDPGPVTANPAHRFADFGLMPPADLYEGRVFQLSQGYPRELPPAERIPPFCLNGFDDRRANWRRFMDDVRAYCFRDNVGGASAEDDWALDRPKK